MIAMEKSPSLGPEVVSFDRRLEQWSGKNDEELEELGDSASRSSQVSERPVSLGLSAYLLHLSDLIFYSLCFSSWSI